MRVKVVFTAAIDVATLTATDLVLTLRPSGTAVSMASNAVTYDPATLTASFTFPAYASGMLPDGRYRATINAGTVANGFGNAIPAAAQVDFLFMRGDVTGDGVVNFDDLVVLAQNYNKTGLTLSQGNLDYDAAGTVNFDDLVILSQRYNATLPALNIATPTKSAITKTKPSGRAADVVGG